MLKKNKFAVVDIGTNSVKCICFANGKSIDMDQDIGLRNKRLTQRSGENIDSQELLRYIKEYIETAHKHGINTDQVYIAATEAFRRSSNKDEIISLIKRETGRLIHTISPKREAYLSILGGLSYIKDSFKDKPDKILYIESGGGSTEVSLIDTNQRSFLSVLRTISIPLGSKDKVEDSNLANYDKSLKEIVSTIGKNDKIAVVVNSSAAGRILARQEKLQRYIPAYVAKKQLNMSAGDFLKQLDEVLSMHNDDVQNDFYLGKGSTQGFVSHCKLLQHIIRQFPKEHQNASLSTTIGGVKVGLQKEIEKANGDKKKIEKILEHNITIGTKESSSSIDVPINNKVWQMKLKIAIGDVNQSANGNFYFQEQPEREMSDVITYVDKNDSNNKIKFTSPNNASVQGNIQAYYAICMVAKKTGKKVNFGAFKTIEQKALLFQACLEKGIEVVNPPELTEFRKCNNFTYIQKLTMKELTVNPVVVNKNTNVY